MMDFPGVVEAAVCGVPHPVLTECVVAAVRAGTGLDVDGLREFVRDRKGPAAPHRIVIVDDLPRTFLGKTDKKRLREQLAEPPDRGAEPRIDAGGLSGEVEGDAHLQDPEEIRRCGQRFCALLAAVSENPYLDVRSLGGQPAGGGR